MGDLIRKGSQPFGGKLRVFSLVIHRVALYAQLEWFLKQSLIRKLSGRELSEKSEWCVVINSWWGPCECSNLSDEFKVGIVAMIRSVGD